MLPVVELLWQGQQLSIDSRSIQAGEIFLALVGENFDGHKYIPEAIAKGASYLIVENTQNIPVTYTSPVLQVANTKLALGEIAKQYRSKFDLKVIAITGSCGKTTTREMLASILAENGTVLFSQNNFNNEIGLPLTLLKLNKNYKYLVLEMGACKLHDIAYLMEIAKPQVGVVTNVGLSHLEKFKTQDNIAKTKGEIYTYLYGNNQKVIINLEDKYAKFWLDTLTTQQVVTIGIKQAADISAALISSTADSITFELRTAEGAIAIVLAAPGMHNVMNALAAAACATAVGVDIDCIKIGLEKFSSIDGRLSLKKGLHGVTIIDDCYNASPSSVAAALEVLAKYAGEKILVLGDMLELGSIGEQMHLEVGMQAKNLGINRIMALGKFAALTIQGFGMNGEYFMDKTQLIKQLLMKITADTVVLIKGSRSTHMEEVSKALMKN